MAKLQKKPALGKQKLKMRKALYAELTAPEREREDCADKWITKPSMGPNDFKRMSTPKPWKGEITLEKHHELLAKERMAMLRMNINRAETGSRTVTAYRPKHSLKPTETAQPSKGWL